ncbi:hypothetical protein T4C_11560 [Trichinella pseudospiralis]|uniref:Uncharacterized protein n=1 Tax=Trichinella pseudospiralis TaxID=6337 RepID=A0A0V1DQX4_TRIPS|nr:hypothetical protein T4D_1682 [Trichinella pseudospiralis]KRY96210.1 hypothetical protein T4C_11560 [Trichinella pseudospiralis]
MFFIDAISYFEDFEKSILLNDREYSERRVIFQERRVSVE